MKTANESKSFERGVGILSKSWPRSEISLYEKGERSPRYKVILALATVFNVDVEHLTGQSIVSRRRAEDHQDCVMQGKYRGIAL